MRKELIFVFALMFLISIGFAYATSNSPVISLIEKNFAGGTTDVRIRILLEDNVVAINETFFPSDCSVLEHSLDQEIDIYEFNDNENIWILGNKSENLDLELSYKIPYDCEVIDEKYYTVDDESLFSGDVGEEGQMIVGPGDGSGQSSSSAGSTSTTSISTIFIEGDTQQADSEEEFDSLVESARKLVGLTDESKILNKKVFFTILILIGVVILIAGFVGFAFFRRPRDFEKQIKSK